MVVPQNQTLRVILWGVFDHCWQNETVGALLGLSQPPRAIPSHSRGLRLVGTEWLALPAPAPGSAGPQGVKPCWELVQERSQQTEACTAVLP